MNAALNRRTALVGIAAAGGLAALASTATAAPQVSRTAWDIAMLRWERAKQHKSALDARYNAAYVRFASLKPSEDLIARRAFPAFYRPTPGELASLNVDELLANFDASKGVTWWGSEEAAEKQRAAFRTIGDYQRQIAHAQKVSAVNDLADAADAAGDATCEAWASLLKTPAPDGEALIFKLEQLIGDEGRTGDDGDRYGDSWSADLLDVALDDARRLLSAGRA